MHANFYAKMMNMWGKMKSWKVSEVTPLCPKLPPFAITFFPEFFQWGRMGKEIFTAFCDSRSLPPINSVQHYYRWTSAFLAEFLTDHGLLLWVLFMCQLRVEAILLSWSELLLHTKKALSEWNPDEYLVDGTQIRRFKGCYKNGKCVWCYPWWVQNGKNCWIRPVLHANIHYVKCTQHLSAFDSWWCKFAVHLILF